MHLNKSSWLLALKMINAIQDDVMTDNIIMLNISNTSIKLFKAGKERQLYINIPIISEIKPKDKTGLFIIEYQSLLRYIDTILNLNQNSNNKKEIVDIALTFNADSTISIATKCLNQNKRVSRISRKIKYHVASLENVTTRGIAIQASNMINRINEYEKKSEIDIWETAGLYNIIDKLSSNNTDNFYISSYTETASTILDNQNLILEMPLNNTIHNTVIISGNNARKLSKALNILLNHKIDNNNKDTICNIDIANSTINEISLGGNLEETWEGINGENSVSQGNLDLQGSQIQANSKQFQITSGAIDIFENKNQAQAKNQNQDKTQSQNLDSLPVLNYPYLTIQLLKPFDTTDAILKTLDGEIAIQIKQSIKAANQISKINNTIINDKYIAYSLIDRKHLLKTINKLKKSEDITISFEPNIESKTKQAYMIFTQTNKEYRLATNNFYEENYIIFGHKVKTTKQQLLDSINQLDTEYLSFDINTNHIKISSVDMKVIKYTEENNWPLHELLINRRQDIQLKRVYIDYEQ